MSSIYYINSTHRLTGTSGQFSYSIQLPSQNGYDRVCLLAANIPITYYLIPNGYNQFVLTELKSGVTTMATITVPIGNYNVNSFKSTVSSLLTNASPNHWIYTLSFPNSYSDAQTGKLTYTVSGPAVGDLASFTFTQDMSEQFGFDEFSTVAFVNNSLTSHNAVSFVPETSILIHSDIVSNENTDILEVVFANNSVPLSNAVYSCPDVHGYSKRFRTNQSNVYNFSLTDEHGKQLDLNGVSCLFTIALYKSDDLTEYVKKYTKMIELEKQSE